MIQHASAIEEFNAQVKIPSGSFDGEKEGNCIKFFISEGHPICELHSNQTQNGKLDVLVTVMDNLVYVYDKRDLM